MRGALEFPEELFKILKFGRMGLGENGVLKFFDFSEDGFAESRLVDENGRMSNQMFKDLCGDGGIVLWVGAGLSALEHHSNVMFGSHVFGKAIL